MTLSDYNSLTVGDTTEEDLGDYASTCEQDSENSLGGSGWTCYGEDEISNASLIFVDGTLESKSQFGLE